MLINNTSNPRTVNIEAGETTTTSYDIQCETPNQPPVASITYECKNLRCSFDGSGSTDSDGSLQTYAWSFGDKGSGKGTQVSHTYETAGIYTIKLTVTDDDGANGSAGKDVKVTLPKVSGLSPDSGPRGTEVTINGTNFSSNASDDQVQFTSGSGKVGATIKSALETQLVVDVPADATDGPIYVTVYDYTVKGPAFDVVTTGTIEVNITTDGVSQDEDGYLLSIDGSEGVRTKINDIITKDGLSQGSHQVGLSDLASNCYITQDRSNPYSVDVSAGKTTNTQIDIHCEEPNRPPTADFTYSCENLSCNFDGSGSSDQETAIQDYIWDFGDGRTSNGKTISHNFETAGTYTVELKVTDYDDASGSVTKDVTVSLPKIDSISPNSGPVGTEVTINGSGFSAEKTNDTVSFTSGGSEVNATIKSASETQVVVDVPSDATSGPVYVSTYGYRVQGPVFNVQQPGDLRVTTTIEGTQRDSDGYMVTVSDEGSKSILNQGSVTFNDITQNSVQVELTGVAANCRVDGENPRTVSIPSGDITGTTFNVDCTQDLKGQIIFVSNRTGNNDIFSQDANSNIPRQITDTGDYEYLPKLSPDGLRIAYIAYANGRQIFIMDSDGSDVEQITDSGYYHGVDWSPDGSKLVVSRSDNSDFPSDIYTMNIDGTNQQNLTNTSSDREGSPDWSQDGTSIVYESYLSGNANIFTINPDGSNKVQLTSGNSARQPEWSPDGSKIAFVQPDTTNNSNIHIMDADGSNISKLTYSHSSEQSPSWSPDGSKIAFARYNDGHYSIYVFSVAVNDIVSGSYTPSDDISPHWNY